MTALRRSRPRMPAARRLETAVSFLADTAWQLLQNVNRRTPSGSFHASWSGAPLPKSAERTAPPLGWPRLTDSLCPTCVKETRARILSGEADPRILVDERVGEIKATILERDGKIVIEKSCPQHGTFSDVLAINPAFLKRIESLF